MSGIKNKSNKFIKLIWLCAALIVFIAVIWLLKNHPGMSLNRNQASTAAFNDSTNATADKKITAGNYAAFKDQGQLAFVREGSLYVLDGEPVSLIKVSRSGSARQPKWSFDGQWLAYIQMSGESDIEGSLYLVKKDGSQLHQVQGLPGNVMELAYCWSPNENHLAVSCGGLWLVEPRETPRQMVKSESEINPWLAWSPDGRQLAYSATLPYKEEEVSNRCDALYTLNISTGKTVRHMVSDSTSASITPVVWWPDGKGLIYWEAPYHSASIAADGLDLCSFKFGSRKSYHFSPGLTDPNWLSMFKDGRLLRVAGAGRALWTEKWLEICTPEKERAERLNIPPGIVAADPSISPDENKIAFVAAPDLGSGDYPNPDKIKSWIASSTLWIANQDGSEARQLVQAGTDICEPKWSKDGQNILYISQDCFWIIDVAGNERHKVLGPFSKEAGRLDFAWYKG